MSYFTCEKLMDHVTRINCPGNVFAFLVEGSERAVLVDTGYGIGSLKQYVDSLTQLPYDVLITHGHLDHAGGAAEFDTVYLNMKDLQVAEKQTTLEARIDYFAKGGTILDANEIIPPKDMSEYLPLCDEQSFDLGGITVTMLDLNGHTPGCMCMLVEELRVILLGDACNSYGYMQFPEGCSLREYYRHLTDFRKHLDRFDQVWFSHPHNFGTKEIVEETITLCEEIISGKRIGMPANIPGMPSDVWIAKEKDDRDRAKDGSMANFLYKKNCI